MNKKLLEGPLRKPIYKPKVFSDKKAPSPSTEMLSKSSVSSPVNQSQFTRIKSAAFYELQNEEKNLLYEFKQAIVPKMNYLKERVKQQDEEMLKKEAEIVKMKSFHESEIACMQDYIDLLKRPTEGINEVQAQLKKETVKSNSLLKALVSKQKECEEFHRNVQDFKVLEAEINDCKLTIAKFQAVCEEQASLIERNNEKADADLISGALGARESDLISIEIIEKLKKDLKIKMNEFVNQSIANFNIARNHLDSMDEKISSVELTQKYLLEVNPKVKMLNQQISILTNEKLELIQQYERDSQLKAQEVSKYKAELEIFREKAKKLLKEVEENTNIYENKLKIIIKENNTLKGKCQEIKEYTKENTDLKQKLKEMITEGKESANQLEQLYETHKKLNEKYSEVQKELKQSLNLVAQLNSDKLLILNELAELKKKAKDSEAEKKALVQESIEKSTRILAKDKKIEELQEKITASGLEIASLNSKKNSLLEKLLVLKDHLSINSKDSRHSHTFSTTIDPSKNFSVEILAQINLNPIVTKKKSFPHISKVDSGTNPINSHSKEDFATQLFAANEEIIEKERIVETLKQKLAKSQSEHETQSIYFESLLEENNMLKQEINRIREELKSSNNYLLEIESALQSVSENKSGEKQLRIEIQALKNELSQIESEKNRIKIDLEIANDIIFQSQRSMDTSEIYKHIDAEEFQKNNEKQLKLIKKKFESAQDLLDKEKKQHEDSVKQLLEADKKMMILKSELNNANTEIRFKEHEAEENKIKIDLLTIECLKLKKEHEQNLIYYERLIAESALRENETLSNLVKIQEYERNLADYEGNLETKQKTIEELYEIIAEYKTEVNRYEERLQEIDKSVASIHKNVNESVEFQRKSLVSSRSLVNLEDPSKFSKLSSSLNEALSKHLFDLKSLLSSPELLKQKPELIDQIQKEYDQNILILTNNLNFQELYESLVKEFNDLKDITEDLEAKLDSKAEEIIELKQTNQRLHDILEEEEKKKKSEDEEVGFDTMSLEKQVSDIEQEDDGENNKIRMLQEEVFRLKSELEVYKENYSSLAYSLSEESLGKKNPDAEISETWIEKDKNTAAIPPRAKKPDENILILDNNESVSENKSISVQGIDLSAEELEFEST